MFKKIMCMLNPTIDNLEEELFSSSFNEDSADNFISSDKININELNNKNETLLHRTLRKNKFKASVWLVKNGIDTDVQDKTGISGLRLAIEKGNMPVINAAFTNPDININQKDHSGRSLLQDAVILGHEKVARFLIEQSIDVNNADKNNRNVIFDAISYGDDGMINTILNDTKIDLNLVDTDGNTVLHNKKVLEDDDLAEKLLLNGANPTICNMAGGNYLTYTALRGEEGERMIDIAIQCGCDLNSKVANTNSILMEVMYAFTKISDTEQSRRKGLKGIAKKLIDSGLDVEAINSKGETALFNIIRLGDIEGCAFLLENKVNVNHINKDGETALAISILQGIKNIDIIILLLQYGASPVIKDKHNQTILELLNNIILHIHDLKAIEDETIFENINVTGNYMLVLKEILSIHTFEYDFLDSNGNPLFFEPFLHGDLPTTRLYLKHGLNINAINNSGHNIFYEYVLQVFEKGEYFDDFRDTLAFLLVNKVSIKSTNKHGQNIYTKIALLKDCNLKLFRKLSELTKHDYKSTDNMGRTIIHSCVWTNNIELLSLVYGVERNIQNIPDNYNILPITYAALFGHKDMVIEFLRRDVLVRSGKPIKHAVKQKFQPLLKNLSKLTEECYDQDYIRKIEILQTEVIKAIKI